MKVNKQLNKMINLLYKNNNKIYWPQLYVRLIIHIFSKLYIILSCYWILVSLLYIAKESTLNFKTNNNQYKELLYRKINMHVIILWKLTSNVIVIQYCYVNVDKINKIRNYVNLLRKLIFILVRRNIFNVK
jgi:hypothetical protein